VTCVSETFFVSLKIFARVEYPISQRVGQVGHILSMGILAGLLGGTRVGQGGTRADHQSASGPVNPRAENAATVNPMHRTRAVSTRTRTR